MTRKAQEEIVGFVAVVVIAIVILVIVVGIVLRSPQAAQARESKDLQQYLESFLTTTSSCARNSPTNFISFSDLLRECAKGSRCEDGTAACVALNRSSYELLALSWPTGPDYPLKGYQLNASYSLTNSSQSESLLFISVGSCVSDRSGAQYVIPSYPGTISTDIILCS